jgi:hypothetical protein
MTALSQAELFGHVPRPDYQTPLRIRVERCACGTDITANAEDPGPSLLRHYDTARHRAWEVTAGFEPPPRVEVVA